VIRGLILFGLAGIVASQLVHLAEGFRQPGLREFAVSWLSPLFGCLCGLASGTCFAFLANRRFPPAARAFTYSLPIVILAASASALVWSAQAGRIPLRP
jgi:hypothetical protein